GMLRAAYAYCGLPAFVSLSMAGSDGADQKTELTAIIFRHDHIILFRIAHHRAADSMREIHHWDIRTPQACHPSNDRIRTRHFSQRRAMHNFFNLENIDAKTLTPTQSKHQHLQPILPRHLGSEIDTIQYTRHITS
ncbi:MAG: hypothetical protein M3H12_00680, partial [Chromatiales bacterium]